MSHEATEQKDPHASQKVSGSCQMSHCVRRFQVRGGGASHRLFQILLDPAVIVEKLTETQTCQVQMCVDDAALCLLRLGSQTSPQAFVCFVGVEDHDGLLLHRHRGGILHRVVFVDYKMWPQPPSTE